VKLVAAHVFRFDSPDRFVAGTVGQPGERTFFLQARDGSQLTSVALEKEQVSVLADRVDAMLDEFIQQDAILQQLPGKLAIVEPGRVRLRSN
jgi:uncharacterized repeat protein (TIGR03847 family)